MNAIQNRIAVANYHAGGIAMTTLILLFGHGTPRILNAFAKILASISRLMHAGRDR
jgi:hypothetical protein